MGRLDEGGFVEPPITEPVPIQDIFATGVEVTYFPEHVRLTYWSDHPLGFGENSLVATERVVVGKVILPRGAFEKAVQRFMEQRANRRRRNQ